MKGNQRGSVWKERDFERWFEKNPTLPDGEVLVPLTRHRQFRRDIDLLCLDAEGGLVLIEVKNERSFREVIGQTLEYLGQFEDVSELETLLQDERPEDVAAIRKEIKAKRWQITKIARQRRILIAAPEFDFPTQSAVTFLKDRFSNADLRIDLLSITPTRKGFDLRLEKPARPEPLSKLGGECGLSPKGRLFFVLPGEEKNLVVYIGRLKEKEFEQPKKAVATQHLVRRRTGSLIHYTGPSRIDPVLVDSTSIGMVWRHRRRPRTATVLIEVRHSSLGGKKLVYFVRKEAGKISYRIRSEAAFEKDYRAIKDPTKVHSVDWSRMLNS